MEQLCKKLEHTAEPAEVRRILFALSESRNRKKNWTILLGGWGNRNSTYDQAVLRWITGWGGHRGAEANSDFLEVVTARLREDQSLLRQVFWYERWETGLSGVQQTMVSQNGPEKDIEGFVVCAYRNTFNRADQMYNRPFSNADMIKLLISFASMLDRPGWILDLDCQNLDEKWQECRKWLKANAPFLYFDSSSGTYILDTDVAGVKRAVSAERQEFTYPERPVPESAPGCP